MTGQFWDLTVSGLAIGSLYALIALGYTLVYGVLQLINFAHSEVFMLGGFAGLFVVRDLLGAGTGDHALAAQIALVAAGTIAGMVVGGAAAFMLERVAYRPLRRKNAPRLAYLISAIGASLFLLNLARKEFGANPKPVPELFPKDTTVFTVFGAPVRTGQLVIMGSALVMLIFLDRFVNRSRLGRGIRAVAQDADTASLLGIDVDRIIVTTFVVGGILGGAAGFLYGLTFNVQFNMGFIPGIKAFTAAVLGGIGNVRGAVIGGLLLGVCENLGVACVSTAWRDVVAFAILVLVLMVRPSGLLGVRLGRTA